MFPDLHNIATTGAVKLPRNALISKKGEGTFSEVLKAQSIKSGKHVAIKCMKNHFDSIDQVNNLREIQALRRLAGHPNIIKLHEARLNRVRLNHALTPYHATKLPRPSLVMFYDQAIGLAASSIVVTLALQNIVQRNTYVSPGHTSVGFGIWHLAGAAYFFGQLFTVAALALDAPSVVFVVKAIEPLTTALLAIPLLNQAFNLRLLGIAGLSDLLVLACIGIMITAMAAHGGFKKIHYSRAYLSIVLSMLANVGFSSRACVAKRALAFESKEPLEAYGKLTVTATQSGLVLLLLWLFLAQSVLDDDDMMSLLRHLSFNPGAWSWFLVETHALLVALKHIFVVILATLLTGAVFNVHMAIGLALVIAGVSWYLSSPASEKDAEKAPQKEAGALSVLLADRCGQLCHCSGHSVLYDEPTGRLALVFELMDMNLYEAIKGRRHYLPEAKVKHYTYEMLKALDHMHRNGIFHRDVKPENLLLLDDEIKLADLGSCRGIYSRQPFTEYISTRWYRAPECLLTDGYYNFKMDLFAAGCVCFEIVALFPLFPGQNEMDQIQKIHNVLGTPAAELLARKFRRNASHMDFNFPEKKGTGIERLIPHAEPELVELMKKLVRYDPDERILARQALKDPYFRELREAEKDLASAVAQLQSGSAAGSTTGSRSRDPMAKAGISATSSVSADHENPEQTHEPSRTSSPGPEESRGALPSIRHERRKAGGVEEDGHDDGMVLPPIGGLKGKRDSKMKTQTFKTAANVSLQKPMHGTTVHGSMAPASGNFEKMMTGGATIGGTSK
eukprot:s262_g1.t1